ncbi:hypothetical protein ACLOJK_006436 [Asimina triloba]
MAATEIGQQVSDHVKSTTSRNFQPQPNRAAANSKYTNGAAAVSTSTVATHDAAAVLHICNVHSSSCSQPKPFSTIETGEGRQQIEGKERKGCGLGRWADSIRPLGHEGGDLLGGSRILVVEGEG